MDIYATAKPPAPECCVPAPPVLEFDEEGNLIGNWGGPGEGYDWPDSNHGITVDYKGNVWIGGNRRGFAAGTASRPAPPRQNHLVVEGQTSRTQSFNYNTVRKFHLSTQLLMQIR